jgi:hypothetical protein
MRLLLKFPTRSRPQQALKTLQTYYNMATRPDLIGIAMSCDSDDDSMSRTLVKEEFGRTMSRFEWSRMFYGNSKTKIEACNANMGEIEYTWDIVMLVSDDMVPIVKGYDDAIRSHMMSSFPDTNGILWFNDGHQGNRLNTLSIMGRAIYSQYGYIYHPSYKSFFCDTEFTDLCRGPLSAKSLYISSCIVRHEHPGNGYGGVDALYVKNQLAWREDLMNYIERKEYPVDWTIMIPTIPGRERSLQALIRNVRELSRQICPQLKIAIRLGFDDRKITIGAKRDQMLQAAEGRYVSFIDDDDTVTPAYFEDALACIEGRFDCMRLRGQISRWTFTHSIATKVTDPMANETTFLRPPNHLNVMKADVAKLFRFVDASSGEDLEWTIRLARSGYNQREYRSDPSRIHYIYEFGDRVMPPGVLEGQRNITCEQKLQQVLIMNRQGAPALRTDIQAEGPQLRLGSRGFART